MSHSSSVEHVERFLRGRLTVAAPEAEATEDTGRRPFVTISRQSGAGGSALADTMLDVFARQTDGSLFGRWQIFDQALCEVVAEDTRLAGSLDSLLSEDYRSRTEEFFHQLFSPSPDQSYLMDRVFRTVRMLAGVGHVIIVGRAGSEVTKDMQGGISLRVVAPIEVRIARLMQRDHIDERMARDKVRHSDASRARLLKRSFGVDIDDPMRYDATFNTDRMSLDGIAEAVAGALRSQASITSP